MVGCQQFLIQCADACGHVTSVLFRKKFCWLQGQFTSLCHLFTWLPSISSSATIASLMLFKQAGQPLGSTFEWILPPPSTPIHSFARPFLNKRITTWVPMPLPLPSESHSHARYFQSVSWLYHWRPNLKTCSSKQINGRKGRKPLTSVSNIPNPNPWQAADFHWQWVDCSPNHLHPATASNIGVSTWLSKLIWHQMFCLT